MILLVGMNLLQISAEDTEDQFDENELDEDFEDSDYDYEFDEEDEDGDGEFEDYNEIYYDDEDESQRIEL